MRAQMALSVTLILPVLALLGGYCYGQNYVPTAHEEIYGTWINQESPNPKKPFFHPQKVIVAADGYQEYYFNTTGSAVQGTVEIDRKWTDTEGNIWYECQHTVTAPGDIKGQKWQELVKLSKSATVRESVFSVVIGDFSASSYPTKIDPNEPTYNIFYRVESKYVPKSDEELYGTWTNEQYYGEGDVWHPQRVVVTADGYVGYNKLSDLVPMFIWKLWIDSKWTDADGNIWYRVRGMGAGKYDKSQELYKLSKSATVMERAFVYVFGDYDASKYPTKIDPNELRYRVLYRAGN